MSGWFTSESIYIKHMWSLFELNRGYIFRAPLFPFFFFNAIIPYICNEMESKFITYCSVISNWNVKKKKTNFFTSTKQTKKNVWELAEIMRCFGFSFTVQEISYCLQFDLDLTKQTGMVDMSITTFLCDHKQKKEKKKRRRFLCSTV